MQRLAELSRIRDPRRLWQRLRLHATRISPTLSWREANGFDRIWRIARERSLVTEGAAQMLFNMARHASRLDGAFAEIGVYRGGTARLLAEVAREAKRELHLFDTFEGMPDTDLANDLHTKGDFADTSLRSVQELLAAFDRVSFHPGFFPATAAGLVETRFSLVHVDVDIHRSVADCCEFFYPRMCAGGVLLFDDYAYHSCPGAKKAVDEFFADKPEPVLHLMTSGAMVLKLP